MHAIAFSVLRDRVLAQDATQQTLLTAWRDLQKLRDPDRFEAWACRILVRNCHAEARQATRWLLATLERPGPEPAVPDQTAGVIARDRIERAFRQLNLDQRLVVVFAYLDLPTAVIAEDLGIPVGTVHSRLHRVASCRTPPAQAASGVVSRSSASIAACTRWSARCRSGRLVRAPRTSTLPTSAASGTMHCGAGDDGQTTTTEWGSVTIGETYPRCAIEASDPRISGNNHSVHDYYKYDGQPRWGVRSYSSVIGNEDGTWVATDGWGYQQPEDGTMFYAGRYRGTDAYEGLSALVVLSQDSWGMRFDVQGIIFPGDLPEAPELPTEAALGSD